MNTVFTDYDAAEEQGAFALFDKLRAKKYERHLIITESKTGVRHTGYITRRNG